MTMVEFHTQSTQAAVDKQYHMNSWNELWIMRLTAAEYYSIENQKKLQ